MSSLNLFQEGRGGPEQGALAVIVAGFFGPAEIVARLVAAATGVAPLAHVLQIAALIDVTRQRDPGFSGSRCVRGFVE